MPIATPLASLAASASPAGSMTALLAEGRSVSELLGAGGAKPTATLSPGAGYERLLIPFEQLAHGWIILSLLLGIAFALGCAAALAWHPQHLRTAGSFDRYRERRILLVIALVGVVVAELVSVDSAMALVVFGIGALIRFRTVLANPEVTAKGILVVVIGLACGLGQFPLAVMLTGAAWILLWFLDRTFGIRMRIDLRHATPAAETVELALREACRRRGYRVMGIDLSREGRRVTIDLLAPISHSPETVEAEIRTLLPPEQQDARISHRVRMAF